MDIEEAKKVLQEHRPDRPRSTDRRRLQAAIDVILNELEKVKIEKLLTAAENINWYKDT